MKIHYDFITEGAEDELRCQIAIALERLPQRKRDGRNRILRAGWDYDNPKKWLRDIPVWCMAWNIAPLTWFNPRFDFEDVNSMTINEYLRGQAIAPHIDSKAFRDVSILSLLADVTMRFTSPSGEMRDFVLPRRSLAVMSGELRDTWKHETLPLDAEQRFSIVYRRRL